MTDGTLRLAEFYRPELPIDLVMAGGITFHDNVRATMTCSTVRYAKYFEALTRIG